VRWPYPGPPGRKLPANLPVNCPALDAVLVDARRHTANCRSQSFGDGRMRSIPPRGGLAVALLAAALAAGCAAGDDPLAAPDTPISANDLMWEFFERHPRRR
jgi:poly(3-hydroxybutyrate) depolymerase